MINFISHKIQRLSKVLAWIILVTLVVKVSKFLYIFVEEYHWDTAFGKIVRGFKKDKVDLKSEEGDSHETNK